MMRLSRSTVELLAENAELADQSTDWPTDSLRLLQAEGVLGWSISQDDGGAGLGREELLAGHEQIASACLTTAFILSQRESAVRHFIKGPAHLGKRFLPGLASGELFATVGLSQLTTSRQHGGPALRASVLEDGGYELCGEIPWVTGADQADVIVVGATLETNAQILVALLPDGEGVSFEPPMPLAALSGSRTSAIRCDRVKVDATLVLAGPSERVLGALGGGGLETSNLALGLAEAATVFLEEEQFSREYLAPVASHFRATINQARGRLRELLSSTPDPDAVMQVREDCTKLALRASQACLLSAKGAGFVSPHMAQRLSRQALFFLVWSCPRPVAAGVLQSLLGSD